MKINPIFKFLLVAPFYFYAQLGRGQINTVKGYNYQDVNELSFNVDASCTAAELEKKHEIEYNYTTFQLAKAVNDIFKSSQEVVDQVVGNYVIYKRPYLNKSLGDERFSWIMIRPNDTIKRPLVSITHGGKSGGASPQRVFSLGVFDFVQRGYAVVYYQSGSTQNLNPALEDAGFEAKCYTNVQCPLSTWAPDCDMDCFQQAVFLKTQFGIASLNYAAYHASSFHLDTSLFFALGFSGGGIGTLYAAYSDSLTFKNPLFSNIGKLSSLSLYPDARYNLKAVGTLAGGALDSSSIGNQIGTLFDPSDSRTRVIMLHGQDDYAVSSSAGPLIWSDPKGTLSGSKINTGFTLKDEFEELGIENKLVINCSGCHSLFSWPCNYADDCLGNNPDFLACLSWRDDNNYTGLDFDNICASKNDLPEGMQIDYVMSQIHDYSKIIAQFFQQDIPRSGPSKVADQFIEDLLANDNVAAINPIDYPYDESSENTNGHLGFSNKCLKQNCIGLYFNRDGLGLSPNNLLYSGDFATIPRVKAGIFNDDFSIEMNFKPINHSGIGILFSYLNNGIQGFEIFINKEGFIQFNKNDSKGLGSIIGNINVNNDSCHHIALTRKENLFSIYVDGYLAGSKTFDVAFPEVNNYRIGNSLVEIGEKKGLNGMIKNLKLWDISISKNQFNQNNLDAETQNLLSEWKINLNLAQEVPNTKGLNNLILGEQASTSRYDPRWMENDEMCACQNMNTMDSRNEMVDVSDYYLIYPNPSRGQFTLQKNHYGGENPELRIYDVKGNLILKKLLSGEKMDFELDQNGIYIMKIMDSEITQISKIFVAK